jgi:hypothetical protein
MFIKFRGQKMWDLGCDGQTGMTGKNLDFEKLWFGTMVAPAVASPFWGGGAKKILRKHWAVEQFYWSHPFYSILVSEKT